MVALSTLTTLDNGRLPFMLRLDSTVLCLVSLLVASFAVSGSPLIITASCILLAWDLIYLALLLRGIRIPLPLTITCDFISWLLAVGWGTLFSIFSIPALGRMLSGGFYCIPSHHSSHDYCDRQKNMIKATVATCVLLWVLT